jgi:hypothetical protein
MLTKKTLYSKAKSFNPGTSSPNTGAWVLENGFSIETGGWDLICNLNFIT